MAVTITERDKRTLLIGAIAVPGILLYFLVVEPWFGGWMEVRKDLANQQAQLAELSADDSGSKAKLLGLYKAVPVMEMPVDEQKQKLLFREKFTEQLKRARVNFTSLKVFKPVKSDSYSGYKVVKMQVKASCQYPQLADLLGKLRENPYFVGVEELRIKQEDRKKRIVGVDLTVTTLCKS